MSTYLLTNRGTPADKTLEGARNTHIRLLPLPRHSPDLWAT
jgi:hypothetical protein